MKITAIRLDRMRLPLDPPLRAAWYPVEFPHDPPGWTVARRDFFLAEPVSADASGYLSVPDRPGLGAVIDEDAIRRWAVS